MAAFTANLAMLKQIPQNRQRPTEVLSIPLILHFSVNSLITENIGCFIMFHQVDGHH